MSTQKTQAKRAKTALVLSKKLEAASKAMNEFLRACADDGDRAPYIDDDRVTLRDRMSEYSAFAENIHDAYQIKNAL